MAGAGKAGDSKVSALLEKLIFGNRVLIVAESEGRGKGATFTVTFPEMKKETSMDTATSTALSGTPLADIHLLIVDDDSDWRQLLSLALEGLGATVVAADSAETGVNLLESADRHPDVILADIGDDKAGTTARITEAPATEVAAR